MAWAAEGGSTTLYNAVLEVFDDSNGCRVVWTTDLLPNEMAGPIAGMQEQGLALMKKSLER
jgi:hypothetical protein